ncbi:hypothetical protein RHMOL_Rhmol05G0154900 [Rhododendron molle]|uniref:Uncharacterized protein n=1 Tax=Rhododendron molle TaxID=49168 RepID=A0ACC0NQE8_RHOML|nr:hypothetical protein RHMOL_Rhmol05G0154900 [Rhododendron molle]
MPNRARRSSGPRSVSHRRERRWTYTREEAAIRELLPVTNGTWTGGPAEGAHLHIVHLSDARSSLELIKKAKHNCGDSLTVETCTHYLAFSAEEIQDGDTRFKCRDSANKETLWEALMFVLPVTWTYGLKYEITLEQLASWWSEKPAKLAGLDLKIHVLKKIDDISCRI